MSYVDLFAVIHSRMPITVCAKDNLIDIFRDDKRPLRIRQANGKSVSHLEFACRFFNLYCDFGKCFVRWPIGNNYSRLGIS